MKTLEYQAIVETYGMSSVEDLSNAISYTIASRKCSFLEAESYANEISDDFRHEDWLVVDQIVAAYERGER